jgi:2-aminoadipate transaminase
MLQRIIDSGYRCMGGGANPLIANAIATYCQRGLLDAHLDTLRRLYSQRRDLTLAALEANMPEDVKWTRPTGGCFVWLTLPRALDAREVSERAKAEGVWILAGHRFFAEEPTGQHLRLAFSYLPQDQIGSGIETLSEVIGTRVPG